MQPLKEKTYTDLQSIVWGGPRAFSLLSTLLFFAVEAAATASLNSSLDAYSMVHHQPMSFRDVGSQQQQQQQRGRLPVSSREEKPPSDIQATLRELHQQLGEDADEDQDDGGDADGDEDFEEVHPQEEYLEGVPSSSSPMCSSPSPQHQVLTPGSARSLRKRIREEDFSCSTPMGE